MNKPKFTLGPWTIKSVGTKLYIKSGDNTVAEVWETYQIDFRQKIANAVLIEAAPEMYAELERICNECCDDSAACPCCNIRKVLAKARGESEVEK